MSTDDPPASLHNQGSTTSHSSNITIKSALWDNPFTSEQTYVPHYTIRGGKAEQYKRAASMVRRSVQPLQIAFRNLTYRVLLERKVKRDGLKVSSEKTILKDLNGIFCSGRLTAIMGSSGSGKTSMLNALSGRLLKGHLSGEILVNGNDYSDRINSISGYVAQDDVFLATMTVKEAIKMSALLRLPKTVDKEERMNRVEDVIELLHLENCQDTEIGSPDQKGVSGGERKRTSIGMELVANPPILFLDEPTSGLDAYTAFTVIKYLARLCKQGRTVILTIHQPSSEIFALFDDLLVLVEGQIAYYGVATQMVDYFSRLDYTFPIFGNPADYLFMEILRPADLEELDAFMRKLSQPVVHTVDGKDQQDQLVIDGGRESAKERVERLVRAWKESPEYEQWMIQVRNPAQEGVYAETLRRLAPFHRQFIYLFGRAGRNFIRNRELNSIRILKAVIMGVVFGLTYLDSNRYSINDQIRNKTALLFFYCLEAFDDSIDGSLFIFNKEREVFFHEYKAGYYTTTAYFISKFLVELPLSFVLPYLVVLISYYMVGFSPPFSDYLMIATLTALCSISGMGFGILLASLSDNLATIVDASIMVIVIYALISGFLVNPSAMPVYISWAKYTSPVYYSFSGSMQVEFSRSLPNCDPTQSNCDGNLVLELFGLSNSFPPGIDVVFLVTIWLVLSFTAYICLVIITRIKYSTPKRH